MNSHQHYQSDVDHQIFQIDDLKLNEEFHAFFDRADTYITVSLTKENNFNQRSISFCQRFYDASIFKHVIHENIFDVYNIFLRDEDSLWNHDFYELGFFYVNR